jgi:hypothetical protein
MPRVYFTVAGNGPEKGKRLMDQFVMEGNDPDAVPFGVNRLLAMLVSASLIKAADIPQKQVRLDFDRLINKVCVAEVYDEEYQGRMMSRVGAYLPPAEAEDEDDEEEEEEEEAPPARRRAAQTARAGGTAAASTRNGSRAATATRSRRAAPAEEEEDDDEDADEDEEGDEEEFPF